MFFLGGHVDPTVRLTRFDTVHIRIDACHAFRPESDATSHGDSGNISQTNASPAERRSRWAHATKDELRARPLQPSILPDMGGVVRL